MHFVLGQRSPINGKGAGGRGGNVGGRDILTQQRVSLGIWKSHMAPPLWGPGLPARGSIFPSRGRAGTDRLPQARAPTTTNSHSPCCWGTCRENTAGPCFGAGPRNFLIGSPFHSGVFTRRRVLPKPLEDGFRTKRWVQAADPPPPRPQVLGVPSRTRRFLGGRGEGEGPSVGAARLGQENYGSARGDSFSRLCSATN